MPVRTNPRYPVVDGHLSNSCYLRAVDKCFATLNRKHLAKFGRPLDITTYDHILFHQPYQKLVRDAVPVPICKGTIL